MRRSDRDDAQDARKQGKEARALFLAPERADDLHVAAEEDHYADRGLGCHGGKHRGAEEDDPEYNQSNSQDLQPDSFGSDRLQLMADHLA